MLPMKHIIVLNILKFLNKPFKLFKCHNFLSNFIVSSKF